MALAGPFSLAALLLCLAGAAAHSIQVHHVTFENFEGQEVPVTVMVDELRQVAVVSPVNDDQGSTSLYDFDQRVVAHRSSASAECFLERIEDDFYEHESRLQAIHEQAANELTSTLYTWNVNLTDVETGDQAGEKVQRFCAGMTATWLSPERPELLEFDGIEYPIGVQDEPAASAQISYRSKRSANTWGGQSQSAWSHYGRGSGSSNALATPKRAQAAVGG
ncbi:uncharacterized protein LOC119105787 [Pollicipes pollicipes]|uniref:uncharacterized protein LOC119105787 n=1 Tax=Pollicipes pollicipes TaxID=41117 RepID=UPI0018855C93|nr:uncharacterized protein LOC119105787 [Pollicipes pollicipes]